MKQLKRKALSCALVQALGTGVALSLIATGAAAQQTQKVEKIEVTGSNIKRVDMETVAPVEIITREQIERTGQGTVAEVIRNLPANSGASFSESFTNSFAPGASGIALRGLGQKTTLVLLNGRRTAGYGFAQNIQDTFVDLNSIPTAAVERIEILKDGASAVYGSDAIAGVVNIILRKDYRGAEVSGSYGYFEGKNEYRAGITAGVGDLAKDRYNLFGTFDYYKRDLLMMSDTKFGHTRDMRGYDGGRNATSLTGAGTWRQLTAANGLTNVQRANSDCSTNGTVLTNTQAVAAGLIAAPLGNTGFDLAGNTFCSKDFNDQFTALPSTERYGFLGRGTYTFSDTMTGYIEAALSRIESFQRFQAPFFAGTTGLQQTGGGLRPFTYNINFAPGSAGNPFSTNARYQGVHNDLGTRDTDVTSDTTRLLAGLQYTFGKWDFDSAVGYSKNEVDSVSPGTSLSGTSAAFGVPPTPQPPVPVSTTSSYNLDRWTSNSAASRQQLQTTFTRSAESELKFIDTKATTELWQMAGGPVGLALGFEYREEKLHDQATDNLVTGDVLGRGITATNGKRDNTAVYGELSIPITRAIEAQVAGRYDKYSDYGNSSTPKVGMRWRPLSTLLLRANWGKGFRAPSLPEISPSVATFFTSVIDPTNNRTVQVSGVFAGNPDLEPEKSESWTAGIVWEPTRDFSVGVNYYKIDWKNIVFGNCCQDIVDAGDPARVIRDPLTGDIVTVLGNYINIANTKTNGVDLDVRGSQSSDFGKFTGRANMTYIDSFKEEGVEYVGTNGGSNTIPRFKGVFGIDWDYRAFSATVNLNFTKGWYQQALPSSWFTMQDQRFQQGTYPEKIKNYRTLDIYTKYNLNKNLSGYFAVVNAENKTPPYDPGFSATFLYDFSQFDIRGRTFRVGLNYKL